MKITTIILAHFKQREQNLRPIIDSLKAGTVVPDNIIVFIDNPEIQFPYFTDDVTIIRSSKSFLPIIRFAIGSVCEADYCFFLDDDLMVGKKTLENFREYSFLHHYSVLGLEGSILGHTENPYSNDTSIKRGNTLVKVDIVIRTYFVPTSILSCGLRLRAEYPDLPRTSLDDVFLCLGNKYLLGNENYAIPIDKDSDLTELPDGGIGQSLSGDHYKNRNIVCWFLMKKYE